MSDPQSVRFPPFRLELASQRLWRGLDEIPLRPKTIAVLHHLILNPRRLVTKEELLRAVWGDIAISPETLRGSLRELRSALREDARSPRFIETVHGRGYRFVGAIEESGKEALARVDRPTLVGRGDALDSLEKAFSDALGGQRRTVFVTGEPGIGKTTVVEAFVSKLRDGGRARCTHGQCVSGYGDREPYLPVLEALGRLGRQPGGKHFVELLERHAPTWLAELPGLVEPERIAHLQASAVRVNRERMLRELADAVEAISSEQPLALLLEDLHWSDPATLDAIDLLSRRSDPARLLLICTHRPVSSRDLRGQLSRLAALRAELGLHTLGRDVSLGLLTREDARAYLDHRFPGTASMERLLDFVYGRSDGNPMVMVNHADALEREGRLVEEGGVWLLRDDFGDLAIPQGVRQMIEFQIDQLDAAEQRALEIASVAGMRFDVAAIAAAERDASDADMHLLRVAREHGLIRAEGDAWRFAHALHQEVLYERVAPSRRRALHHELGLLIEAANRDDTRPVAAALAMHFELGGDPIRAVLYLGQAAEVGIQRSTHEEASLQLRHALELLASRSDDATEFRPIEFRLLALLGNCLTLTKGYVDPEVRDVFQRAAELSRQLDARTPGLMAVLAGLCGFYELRGEHAAADAIARRQRRVAERTGDAYDRVVASLSSAITWFSVGRYEEAAAQIDVGRAGYDPDNHGPAVRPEATADVGVQCMGHGSLVLAARGDFAVARRWSADATALASRQGHGPSRVLAWFYAMMLEQHLGDVDRADAAAHACLALSNELRFPFYVPAALVISGWAAAQQGRAAEGAQQAAGGLALLRAAGAVLGQPLYCSMLAEAYLLAGQIDEGLQVVADGLSVVRNTGEVASEPSLHWMRGELLLHPAKAAGEDAHSVAEASFRNGIEVARRCGAPGQALGPAISLARLCRSQNRVEEARRLLDASVDGFPLELDVPILRRAAAALAEL